MSYKRVGWIRIIMPNIYWLASQNILIYVSTSFSAILWGKYYYPHFYRRNRRVYQQDYPTGNKPLIMTSTHHGNQAICPKSWTPFTKPDCLWELFSHSEPQFLLGPHLVLLCMGIMRYQGLKPEFLNLTYKNDPLSLFPWSKLFKVIILFYFGFGSYWLWSGLTTGPELRDHAWWGSKNFMGCWELNLDWLTTGK